MERAKGKLCPKYLAIIILTCLLVGGFAGYAVQASEPRPEMVVDEKSGTISFVIDGKDVATISANGVHVNGDLSYTGTIRDTGDLPTSEGTGGVHAKE